MPVSENSQGIPFRFEALSHDLQAFRSPAFTRALAQLSRFNRDDTATLLLEGESGTGKTVLARHLHSTSSRRNKPFQHAVLSAMDDNLAASDVFGHVAGAYTDAKLARAGLFVSANGGTLFLDEVAKASPLVQQKLLHVIEYGEVRPVGSDRDVRVDVRLILATNVCLEELVMEGKFLPDLYARISAFKTRLPSVRERRRDIPQLVEFALARHAAAAGYDAPPHVEPRVMSALERAPWKYNLRELDSTVHRLLLEAEGVPTLTLQHCRAELGYLRDLAKGDVLLTEDRVTDAIAEVGSVAGAARKLGVSRTTLYRQKGRRTAPGISSSVNSTSRQAEERTVVVPHVMDG